MEVWRLHSVIPLDKEIQAIKGSYELENYPLLGLIILISY